MSGDWAGFLAAALAGDSGQQQGPRAGLDEITRSQRKRARRNAAARAAGLAAYQRAMDDRYPEGELRVAASVWWDDPGPPQVWAAIPTWSSGQVLNASDVNSWLVPLLVVKPGDTSRSSTTTLTADPDLTFAVAASATYQWECYLDYEGGVQGNSDLKLQWSVPASATMRFGSQYVSSAGATRVFDTSTQASTVTPGSNGAGVLQGIHMQGSVVTSSTAGSVTLTWAQNTSSGTATIVHAQSFLMAQRYA